MTNKVEVQSMINLADENYSHRISQIADKIYKENLAPFCRKYNMHFIAGMGIFVFSDNETNESVYPDDIDNEEFTILYDLLETTVTFDCYSIGSQLNDFDPREEARMLQNINPNERPKS